MGKLTKSTQTSLSCEINFCFKMYSKGSTRSRQAVQELLAEHNKDLIKDFFYDDCGKCQGFRNTYSTLNPVAPYSNSFEQENHKSNYQW